MTGADEQELRSRLDTALMTITPRPAPIDTVMRQGRHVMYRRRVSVTAGLAAVALAAVAVPSLLNQHAARPAVTRPAAVTVLPPGPGSLAGLIASGTVGATRWSVRLTGHGCFAVTGATVACQAYTPPDGIATFTGVGGEGYTTEFGPVKPAVTRVTVVLGDGQLLVLHPVRAAGLRWVAFPVPAGTEVLRLTAYAGRAELGYAIPFTDPAGASNVPSINAWLAPGAAGHPRVTVRLGPGIVEYAGPWGRCFASPTSNGTGSFSDCRAGFGSELRDGQPVSVLMAPPPGGSPDIYLATAGAQVSRVTVSVSGGQLLRPSIVRGADGEKFFTYTVGHGQKALRWTAFDAAGQRLGSGSAGLG
jgi:hypothetical protein